MISAPKILARYRGVMWEPIENTGERVFAILCVEPLGPEAEHLAPQAYVLLSAERLRSLLGRARGDSASAMLSECAAFMTDRLVRGAPIEQVQPLFHSFSLGPVQQARAYSVEQFLDATVRTLTVFGSAADLYAPDLLSPPNATRRTSEFIRQIRRTFAAGDDERQRRFHVRLQREQDAPIVFIDYAVGPVVLQVASVPSSSNQAPPAEAELKGKILDLEVVRTEFGVNRFEPTLMLNVRSLTEAPDSDGTRIAKEAHEQIRRYAEWAKVRVIEVTSAGEASSELERLEALLR
ncbi:hypothetical protein [Variovorax sp. OV700]|uniref:hypothetical protein n=1 Tax=Variovorax sp. OV700 TaxID=1882826 RepID=UPI00088DA929|nr:hypothetical protein [Variovorax sp. OV700]SDI59627.1 hypothetical protein SAMN05444748_10626 [Variovorax sp. OV700]